MIRRWLDAIADFFLDHDWLYERRREEVLAKRATNQTHRDVRADWRDQRLDEAFGIRGPEKEHRP